MSQLAKRAGVNEQTLRNFLQQRTEATSDESLIAIFAAIGMDLKINVTFEYEIKG